MPPDTSSLVEALTLLPEQQPATLRLLALLDDPDVEARDVIAVLETDPAMTARIMTLANSAFFSVRTKADNVWSAVMIVGFNVVRALVAAGSLGVRAGNSEMPRGFYEHAIASAAGASVLASRTRTRAADAFSAALLHDVGAALLYRAHPRGFAQAAAATGGTRMELAAERRVFGFGHDEVAGVVLDALHFPAPLTGAVREHNRLPDVTSGPLSRLVIGGIGLAEQLGVGGCTDPVAAAPAALASLDIAVGELPDLVRATEQEMAELRSIFA